MQNTLKRIGINLKAVSLFGFVLTFEECIIYHSEPLIQIKKVIYHMPMNCFCIRIFKLGEIRPIPFDQILESLLKQNSLQRKGLEILAWLH